MSSITANGRIYFRRDLPRARVEWRYVFDHEGQPFAWETRATDSNVSFVLPRIRCGLSVLVERGPTSQMFQRPKNELTEKYLTGTFG